MRRNNKPNKYFKIQINTKLIQSHRRTSYSGNYDGSVDHTGNEEEIKMNKPFEKRFTETIPNIRPHNHICYQPETMQLEEISKKEITVKRSDIINNNLEIKKNLLTMKSFSKVIRASSWKHYNHKTITSSILLPFVILFLLPTFTTITHKEQQHYHQLSQFNRKQQNELNRIMEAKQLLLELIRLPFERLRFVSCGGLINCAMAKEINTRHDLQEEETHMRMLAPENRSYGGGGVNSGSQYNHNHNHPRSPQAMAAMAPEYDQLPPDGNGQLNGGGGGGGDSGGTGLMPPGPGGEGVASMGGGPIEARSDLPAVRALNVKCEKNHMTVNIVFDRPFYGMVFSKGHYNDQKCIHLPANSGQTSVNFDIHLGKCGMSSSEAGGQHLQTGSQGSQLQPNGLFIENTIIIQYDPLVQEIYDQARKLRCTWYDYYEKSVTFRPYNVDMMDAVTANFLGDNIQCWMQIQVGKGPWASEVAGIVKIGQTMTMVLAIKDDENRFDMLVRNCVANDGKHQPIQLVDEYGCVARPKIMTKFNKVRNFGPSATVVSYAHFQAFKFPDSMSVHFQCVIQVCRYECPVPQCNGNGQETGPGSSGAELGGSIGGGSSDYAASGTEIVSSKEPLPNHLNHQHQPYHTMSGINRSAINLKLDESQGRVQVKLDTSMITGSSVNNARQQQGPLPPHLLQVSASTNGAMESVNFAPTPSDRGYLIGNLYQQQSSSTSPQPPYYRQATAGGVGRAVAPGSSQSAILATGVSGLASRQAPSSGLTGHYSPATSYSASSNPNILHHRSSSSFASRLGDLAPEDSPNPLSGLTTDASPLTLIALPRALRAAPANLTSGGSVKAANLARVKRSPQAQLDSTAVRTQRTIQVVSPDDVAFSLLSPSDLQDPFSPSSYQQSQNENLRIRSDQSQVCFSPSKFALGILFALITVASSMILVIFLVLRQRARLDEKLSYSFEPPGSMANQTAILKQNEQDNSIINQDISNQGRQRRRQEEEIQQRNKYLARLYSQFAPATYWQDPERSQRGRA